MKALSYVPIFNFIVEKRNGQKETKTMLSVVKTGIRPHIPKYKKDILRMSVNKKMASMERLELPTVRLEGGCSIQLSYMDT